MFFKFDCVMGDVMMSPWKTSAWLVAARCLRTKRDFIKGHICDQAKLEELMDGRNFGCLKGCLTAPSSPEPETGVLSPEDNHVTADFLTFVKHPFSMYSSLSKNLESVAQPLNPAHVRNLETLIHLERNGNKLEFQEIWAGLYLKALMVMQERCLLACIAIAEDAKGAADANGAEGGEEKKAYISGFEELGTMRYQELQGGKVYGFNTRKMTASEVRGKGLDALDCFKRALKAFRVAPDVKGIKEWALLFMIGKCHEKIAGTYSLGTEEWKTHAKAALKMLKEAFEKGSETDKISIGKDKRSDEMGGCCHGLAEVYYRLHAFRMKVFLKAARTGDSNSIMAALDLISPGPLAGSLEKLRDNAMATVKGLAEVFTNCRKHTNQYFHRSVYRHAQLILLSPALVNHGEVKWPNTYKDILAFPQLTIDEKSEIKGYVTGCSHVASASDRMSILLGKKLDQLVSIWVTVPLSMMPFEAANQSAYKYDYLRAKYAGAYLFCLRMTPRVETVEQLFSWTKNASRDYAGQFSVMSSIVMKDSGMPGCGKGFVWTYRKKLKETLAGIMLDRKVVKLGLGVGAIPGDITKQTKEDELKKFLCMAYESYLYRWNGGKFDGKDLVWTGGGEQSVEIDAMVSIYKELTKLMTTDYEMYDPKVNYDELPGFGGLTSEHELIAMRNRVLSQCHTLWADKVHAYKRGVGSRGRAGWGRKRMAGVYC